MDIEKIIEDTLIKSVTTELKKQMVVTDYGQQIDENGESVFITHFALHITAVQKTPSANLAGKENSHGIRRANDECKFKDIARMILGLENE